MENASKLMIIGFGAALFAGAVLMSTLMYYGVMDMTRSVSDMHQSRSVMEVLDE